MKKFFAICLLVALASCGTSARREALNYLRTNMSAGDRDTLSTELLETNVDYALRARAEFGWAAALPDSVFLNEVLPYAVVDEPRENWRPKFYEIFAPKVRGAATIEEAIVLVNKNINLATGVEYDTRRARTNQSPSESMGQGMASCTGLSIILVDAFRSVGIPARFAGTAGWWDDRGNHSWVEVWIDGKWWFTEFYPDPAGLDNAWFLADAGKADPADRVHAVWATSFRQTADGAFPMVWSEGATTVHGVNVSDRYIARYEEVTRENEAAGTHVDVRFSLYDGEAQTPENRAAVNVDVFEGALQLGGGRTSGPTDDAQKFFTIQVPKNTEISFRWVDFEGVAAEKTVFIGEDPLEIRGSVRN